VYRLGLFVIVLLLGLFLSPWADAGGEKKIPDGDEKEKEKEKEKKPPPAPKVELPLTVQLVSVTIPWPKLPPPPPPLLATVEMKDGTTFLGEFRRADTVTIRTDTLGALALKIDTIRFLDVEGNVHRIMTHGLETFYGLVQTEQINVRLLATEKASPLKRGDLKRIVFPDPPRDLLEP
jgi:hypothetical protein